MTVTRPSNLDVTQTSKPVILRGSLEDWLMAPDAAIRWGTYSSESGLQTGTGGGDNGGYVEYDRPQLMDIESVTKTIYYDTESKTNKAKIVLKIRNSSGQALLGIDARKTIPTSSGGK